MTALTRYQPVIVEYGTLKQAEMQENPYGKWYSRAEVDALIAQQRERIRELESQPPADPQTRAPAP